MGKVPRTLRISQSRKGFLKRKKFVVDKTVEEIKRFVLTFNN